MTVPEELLDRGIVVSGARQIQLVQDLIQQNYLPAR
jgi:hypothetical protein